MALGVRNQVIEFDYYITPDGEEFNLNDGSTRFLMGQGGGGMPPINYLTEQGPFQHGVTVTDFRVQPRLIQMLFRKNGGSRQKYWDNRSTILDFLRPNRQSLGVQFTTGVLRKVMPDGEIRDINVMVDQGPSFQMGDPKSWDAFGFTEVLRFIAFNPFFFNPTQQTLTFSLSSLSNLVFPITFPITFGSSVIDDTQLLTYLGTWEEFPIIEIDGPLEGPTIYNDTTGEYIEMLYNIAAGETVTIDLTDRQKTVTSSLGTDLQGTVEGDLGTWHLAPNPEAPGGVNTIRLTGSGASPGVTQVRVMWNDRYIGL